MAHPTPDLDERPNDQLDFAATEAALAQLAVAVAGLHNPANRVPRLLVGGVWWKRTQCRLAAICQHQHSGFP